MAVDMSVRPERHTWKPGDVTERDAVAALNAALQPLGVSRDDAVGFWIALKSKPSIVLCSSGDQADERVMPALVRLIGGDNSGQVLEFQGHPWWAANSGMIMRAQQRLTSLRLRAFLEGAGRPGARG